MPDLKFLLVALFVFVGFTTQATTGFGGIIVALTLSAHLYPIEALLPVLVPVSCVVTGAVVWRHRREIDAALLLRRILPLMSVGGVLGLLVFDALSGPVLKRLYGMLVAGIAALELCRLAAGRPVPPLPSRTAGAWIGLAGVVHGLYASGGPLLVYAVNGLGLTKGTFRSTLCALWLVLNLALTTVYLAGGKLTAAGLPRVGLLVPVVLLSLLAGEWCHARLKGCRFRLVVILLLMLAGVSLLR